MISTKQIKSKPSFSTTKRIISASFVKPLVASAVILAIDRFYFKNSDLTSNLYFTKDAEIILLVVEKDGLLLICFVEIMIVYKMKIFLFFQY